VHAERVGAGIVLGERGKARAIDVVTRLRGEQRVELGARHAQFAFARQGVARAHHFAARERHRLRAPGAQDCNQQFDLVRVVLRPDAERVAGRIAQPRAGKVEHDMAGFFLRRRR
jgi:hypothetical protein